MRGAGSFGYALGSLPSGEYAVTLYFAEPGFAVSGQRIVDVSAEGVVVLDNFDIFATAGGAFVADIETFTVTVEDGELNVDFDSTNTRVAIVSAIAVTSN